MTFLTRFHLNPARRGAAKLISSPQALHAAVESSFPPGQHESATAGRILWRLDRGQRTSATLYVQSPTRPDLTHLVEQAGWPTSETGWETRSLQPLLENLANGQAWQFRLTANPTVTTPATPGGRGRVIPQVTVAQQERWLIARTEHFGARVQAHAEAESDRAGNLFAISRSGKSTFKRGSSTVTLTTCQYDGTLLVEDSDLLRTALTNGIGRAKGYGCGLMTLAVAPHPSAAFGEDG